MVEKRKYQHLKEMRFDLYKVYYVNNNRTQHKCFRTIRIPMADIEMVNNAQ